MIVRLSILLLLAVSACTPVKAAAVQPEPFLAALAMKETGSGWNGRPGPAGELSKWQITRTVWRQHSREPFSEARVEAKARAVTLAHLAWLADRIRAAGHEPTAERLATCWHYGASRARTASQWGQEVANLYGEFSK